jgi:glucan 1,3-beta-glucosidase
MLNSLFADHVRLPIGFWAFDVSGGEPYIQGAKDYLYKAIGWARQYGIKVIVSHPSSVR